RSKGLPLDIHVDCTIPDEHDHDAEGEEDSDEEKEVPFNPDLYDRFGWGSPPLSASAEESSAAATTATTHGQQYAEDHKDCHHPPPPFSLQDLTQILDLIIPHVARWRSLEVTCSVYEYMYNLLSRLAKCPSAPLLEVLQLYHYEDCEEYEVFEPAALREAFLLFSGNAPVLRDVALWGVHLDWDRSLSFLRGLRDLELTYHAKDVRPSYAAFTSIIAASPALRTLSLCLSGPQDHVPSDPSLDSGIANPNDWGLPENPISIPSLNDLVLCYHEAAYAVSLLQKLSVPNVHSLALDFDGEDYSAFVRQLAQPMPVPADSHPKLPSILAGLEHLKISGLPCDARSIDAMYEQLGGLQTINLNCSGEDEEKLFRRLYKPSSSSSSSVTPGQNITKIVCPKLHTVTTTGIPGAEMRQFVEARRAAGVPIKRVMLSEEDDVDEKDEKWLRAHVEEFDFFEPSDSEEEFDDVDGDEDEEQELQHWF
ncbi:hypothetical protein DXG03_000932, partial [Asterophora parasitica]